MFNGTGWAGTELWELLLLEGCGGRGALLIMIFELDPCATGTGAEGAPAGYVQCQWHFDVIQGSGLVLPSLVWRGRWLVAGATGSTGDNVKQHMDGTWQR